MTRRRLSRKALLWILAPAALIGVGYGFLMRPAHPTTVREVEASLAGALKPGQGRSEVEAYLQAQGIVFSYIDDAKQPVEESTAVQQMGLPVAEIGGVIMALIEDTHRELLSSESIALTFAFDRRERLLKWQVRSVFTGP